MMRVYVAGSSANLSHVEGWTERLKEVLPGVKITSDWIQNVPNQVGGANPPSAPHDARMAWSLDCLRKVASSDIVWHIYPEVVDVGYGAPFEMGYAYALNKPTVVSGPFMNSIFTSLQDVRFGLHSSAVEYLLKQAPVYA